VEGLIAAMLMCVGKSVSLCVYGVSYVSITVPILGGLLLYGLGMVTYGSLRMSLVSSVRLNLNVVLRA
jgi:hypothetical protein